MYACFCPVLIDYEGVVKLSEDFNGADLRNVCTEAGE
jgi:26S proteasome regulatory subunit T4